MKRETVHTILAITGVISFFTGIISGLTWIWADSTIPGKLFATSAIVFILCAWLDRQYEDSEVKFLRDVLNNKPINKSKFQQKLDELTLKRKNQKNDIRS